MPSFSTTSPLPHKLDTDRLPCLATLAPAAAATTQAPVEMFTVPTLRSVAARVMHHTQASARGSNRQA